MQTNRYSLSKKVLQSQIQSVKLGDSIGGGGNADVYRGKLSADGRDVAVKFHLNIAPKRYERFKDEVLVVTTRLRESEYVLPILDHHFPAAPSENSVPWYTMPLASTLLKYTASRSVVERFQLLLQLSGGLAEMHSSDVAHRDIKPQNLFFYDGRACFGDFGLAKFPDVSGVTTAT